MVKQLGGLHIAINNAGINKNAAAEDTTEEDWDMTFNVNTKGVFLCCQVGKLQFVSCSCAVGCPVQSGGNKMPRVLTSAAWSCAGKRSGMASPYQTSQPLKGLHAPQLVGSP